MILKGLLSIHNWGHCENFGVIVNKCSGSQFFVSTISTHHHNQKFENFNKTRKQNEFNVNNGIGLFQIYLK